MKISKGIKHIVLLLIVLIIGLTLGGASVFLKTRNETKRTVEVTGYGIVNAQADGATIYADVLTSASGKEQARTDNKIASDKLKQALTTKGISESSITMYTYEPQQGGYDASPTTSPIPNNFPFIAKTQFSIHIAKEDLNSISDFHKIANAFPFTANVSTSYEVKDILVYKNKAREQALQDARNQTEKIAQINRERIGDILSIKDLQPTDPTYQPTFPDKTAQVTASYEVKYTLD